MSALVPAHVPSPAMAELKKDGLLDRLGDEHVLAGFHEMLAAYKVLPPAPAVPVAGGAARPLPAGRALPPGRARVYRCRGMTVPTPAT